MSIEEQLAQVAKEVREIRSAQVDDQDAGVPRLLTTAEAADILRVKPKTVRAYVRAGRLSALRFGRSLRIREDELEALLRSGTGHESASVAEAADRLLRG